MNNSNEMKGLKKMICNKQFKSKKAWIKIVEAFIAVLLILSAMMILISKDKEVISREGEINKLLSSTLEIISKNEVLRSQILANDTSGVNQTIEKIIPFWIEYSSNICDYNEVCPNPVGYIDKAVYSKEKPIFANLTYTAENPLKIKIFFWEKDI